MGIFTKVIRNDGRKSEVQVRTDGITGGLREKQTTNNRGEAYHENRDEGKWGRIYVDGREVYRGKLSDSHIINKDD